MNNISEQNKKSDETKKKIVVTAIALFCEKGFDETTMRDMADKAGVALGTYYYYFKTKEEVILAFYHQTQKEAGEEALKICRQKGDLREKILKIINYKFEQYKPYRPLLSVLSRVAGNTAHPLSPFSIHTKEIRDEAVFLFEEAIHSVSYKISKDLRPYLAHLLWFYQMGVIFFWLNDESENQINTKFLTETSLDIIFGLLRFSSFPMVRGLRKKLVSLLENFIPGTKG